MGIRRQAGQERSWPAIHWQTPSLVIAIITLVAVTGAVLSDAPRWPFKRGPDLDHLNPAQPYAVGHLLPDDSRLPDRRWLRNPRRWRQLATGEPDWCAQRCMPGQLPLLRRSKPARSWRHSGQERGWLDPS